MLAPFHGDEGIQIYTSRDWETAFVERNPVALTVQPPYFIDTDPQLRILNGSFNRYTIGLARALVGVPATELPPIPGWDWGLTYARNIETGHLPDESLLLAARLSSALFLAVSVPLMFLLAQQFGSMLIAYVATGLYALHPVVLLNGRRALQEGSMLFFGLLVVLTAVVIVKRRAASEPVPIYVWLGLITAGACALASKHSAVVFVGAAYGGVWLAELVHFRLGRFGRVTLTLAGCGLLTLMLNIALLPALWNDAVARFNDLLTVRAELIDIQIGIDPNAPMSLIERLTQLVVQPFLTPPAFWEVPLLDFYTAIEGDIAAYLASPLSGYPVGGVIGFAFTLLAVGGMLLSLLPHLRRFGWSLTIVLWVWLLMTTASLLANPLPWQRYYLPLIPVAALFAAISVSRLIQFLTARPAKHDYDENSAPSAA